MKKFLMALLVLIILIPNYVYADNDAWTIIQKDFTQGIDYTTKAGEYFFKIENENNSSKLCYSSDGVNFLITDFQTDVLPIYSEGLYFIFNTVMSDVPESERVYGFNNSPSYILDNNLNLIKQIDHNGYAEYKGFYNGYHYIICSDYSNIIYDNGWIGERKDTTYKTSDGETLEIVSSDEDLSFLYGLILDGEEILYTSYNDHDNEVNTLATHDGSFEILYEKEDYIAKYYENTRVPLISMYYKVGEEIVDWFDERKSVQTIKKKYLSMDGVYGIEMPDDVGCYCFELNDIFYFDRDDNTYYCISKSELENKIKIIYNNKILAFTTPPTIEDGSTLVPMRFLFEQMGADVEWEQDTLTATVTKGEDVISFSIDNTEASVNRSSKTMDVPARLINDKTMIPIRFLSENLGYTVSWDGDSRMVTITAE